MPPATANRDVVVVCGAGAAGMGAAIAAARAGGNVLLVEATSGLGGTVANALIHTIGGIYDSDGEFLNNGVAAELAARLFAAADGQHLGSECLSQSLPNRSH
jgi:thioredoxin reductase